MAAELFTNATALALKETHEDIRLVAGLQANTILGRCAGDVVGFWVLQQPEAPKACGPVCECGVKFTGGLHSDWCPLHG